MDAHRSRRAAESLIAVPPRPTLVVIDTSVVLPACVAGGLRFTGNFHWLAPSLLWSEVVSALHEATWRDELTAEEAAAARVVFAELPLQAVDSAAVRDEAWAIADELGLAKTYDAEFLALARLRGALFVTADARLRRGADRLGFVVDPVELQTRAARA